MVREETLIKYNNKFFLDNQNMSLVENSLKKLNTIVNGKIPIILVILYDTPDSQFKILKKFSKEKDWLMLDLNDLTKQYDRQKIYIGPDIIPIDTHPSIFGHEVISERLYEFLIKNELIPKE